MLDPNRYWPIDKHQLAARLIEVTHDLIESNRQLHDALIAERKQRHHTIAMSVETSLAAKQREADISTFTQWTVVQDLEADIFDQQEEKSLIRFLLEIFDASRS